MQIKKSIAFMLVLAILITSYIQPPIISHATDGGGGITVDSRHYNFKGGSSYYAGGINPNRTGYLCYLVGADGSLIGGMQAKAFRCRNYASLGWSQWMVQSKKGGYRTDYWTGEAKWGYPPFEGEDDHSNEEAIKAWMFELDPSTNTDNAIQFVADNWGTEISERFKSGDYVLVLENMLGFQPYTIEPITATDITNGTYELEIEIKLNIMGSPETINAYGHKSNQLSEATVKKILEKTPKGRLALKNNRLSGTTVAINNIIRSEVNAAIREAVAEQSQGVKTQVGDPVIGTLAQCIEYEKAVRAKPSIFASYTNLVACFAEYIHPNGPGAKAGFKPFGETPRKLSDDEVKDLGVGMMVISAKDPGQTTCDETKLPEPNKAPDESTGKFKIVKSYRTRDINTNVLTDKGNFIKEDSSDEITIENETEYKLLAWKTSTTYKPDILSTAWETSVPATTVQGGIDTKTITMKEPETTLYLLLEKLEGEEEPPEDEKVNFIMSQSTITRRIKLSYPDYTEGMTILKDLTFKWEREAHKYKCTGHTCNYKKLVDEDYKDTDYCTGDALATCTNKEGDKCKGHEVTKTHKVWKDDWHIIYCTYGDWKDEPKNYVAFSLDNSKKDEFPDILATKAGWEVITTTGFGDHTKRIKIHDGDNRKEEEWWNHDLWDYSCVLLRGKDKLTVAEWKNDSEHLNTGANDDLKEVSSKGFAIGNTKAGEREKQLYYDKFTVGIVNDDSLDNTTTYGTTSGASCSTHNFSKDCGDNSKTFKLTKPAPLPEIGVGVKVETYSGSERGGIDDGPSESVESTPNPFSGIPSLVGLDKVKGVEVPSGGTITFLPYIQMNYDTPANPHEYYGRATASHEVAYVLGNYERSITPNDYAEISWKIPEDNPYNLTLDSLQWSTHASALDFISIDTRYGPEANPQIFKVLPGGATLSLHIKNQDRQTLQATTYQCIVEGTGLEQVTNTHGSDGGLTEGNAEAAHTAYVDTVEAAIEQLNVEQWIVKYNGAKASNDELPDVWTISGSITVHPDKDLTNIGHPGQNASKESKYYFRDEEVGAAASQGDLDVQRFDPETKKYTFYINTYGNMYMIEDDSSGNKTNEAIGTPIDPGSLSGIAKEINDRTHVVNKLYLAVEKKTGKDKSGRSITADGEGRWYNEAFDGITVYVQTTQLKVGYINPPQRSSVLDPKLTQKQENQRDMFNKKNYNMSQYRTKPYSKLYSGEYDKAGIFKSTPVYMLDMNMLFKSRQFFIGNVTVDDLH